MKAVINISLILGLLASAGCRKDEPYDEDYCLDPKYKVPLSVMVNLDDSFREHVTIDSVFKNSLDTLLQTRATEVDTVPPILKYYVAAYYAKNSVPTEVESSDTPEVNLKIHPGKYTLVGWVCYESPTKAKGTNFYTDDFSEMLLRNKYNYTGAHPHKLAYRGAEEKNIAYNLSSTSVKATPAMATYRLEATDTAKFEPDKVIVRYTSKLPSAIHARYGHINWWWDDISYKSSIDSCLLASDHVLSQDNKQTSVTVAVEIYDKDGKLRAKKKNVEIPLINGGITTVRGNFYSILEDDDHGATAGSGIQIKTEWDATFEIEL